MDRALESFAFGRGDRVLNCGSGRGVSVRETLAEVRAESGLVFGVRDGPRRAGDPPVLVADTARLQSDLQWSPRHGGFRAIVRSALAWERARAGGTRGPEAGDGACPPRRRQGFAVLFTGLSGAGKSTLANALAAMLRERGGRRVTLLDGDAVRRRLSGELGFSREHRQIHLRRIGVVAAGIVRHGGIAICAPIAPHAAARRELRETVEAAGGFVEVYVSTPLETCEARDPKGLYAKARAGLIEGLWVQSGMVEAVLEPDAEPLVPLVAGGGGTVEGLRLAGGGLVLKIVCAGAVVQIRVRSSAPFPEDGGIKVRHSFGLRMPQTVRRMLEFWSVAGLPAPRIGRGRGARIARW